MMRPQWIAVSATPSGWELNESGGVFVEQVIPPTGLIDPPVAIRPARTHVADLRCDARPPPPPPARTPPPVDTRPARPQVDDLVGEVRATAAAGYRSLITVLTKRM